MIPVFTAKFVMLILNESKIILLPLNYVFNILLNTNISYNEVEPLYNLYYYCFYFMLDNYWSSTNTIKSPKLCILGFRILNPKSLEWGGF